MLSLPVMAPPIPPVSPTGHDTDIWRSIVPRVGTSIPEMSRISVDFPGAVAPEDCHLLAGRDRKGHAAQNSVPAMAGLRVVILADALCDDHWPSRARPAPSRRIRSRRRLGRGVFAHARDQEPGDPVGQETAHDDRRE